MAKFPTASLDLKALTLLDVEHSTPRTQNPTTSMRSIVFHHVAQTNLEIEVQPEKTIKIQQLDAIRIL